jgi:hypothetical protein
LLVGKSVGFILSVHSGMSSQSWSCLIISASFSTTFHSSGVNSLQLASLFAICANLACASGDKLAKI